MPAVSAARLGARASVRVDGVFRDYRNLYSQRTDLTTGRVSDGAGNPFDRTFVENTDDMRRRYAALMAQGSYAGNRFALGGNYTLSRAYGNVEAETVNGPSGASINHYPEYRRAEWNYPDGDLSIDQRHRARGWATYSVPTNAARVRSHSGSCSRSALACRMERSARSTRRASWPIPDTRCRRRSSNISSRRATRSAPKPAIAPTSP